MQKITIKKRKIKRSTEEKRIEIIAHNLYLNEKNKQYLIIKLRIVVSFL